MTRTQKPSIVQVGNVWDDGDTIVVAGWGLGLCVSACACHRDPATGSLAIAEDHTNGLMGLASHRDGGCDCCEPWTADDLAAIVRDLRMVAAFDTPEPLAG